MVTFAFKSNKDTLTITSHTSHTPHHITHLSCISRIHLIGRRFRLLLNFKWLCQISHRGGEELTGSHKERQTTAHLEHLKNLVEHVVVNVTWLQDGFWNIPKMNATTKVAPDNGHYPKPSQLNIVAMALVSMVTTTLLLANRSQSYI